MKEIAKLKKELDYMLINENDYNKILKKSQELDLYINMEMKRINIKLTF